jgi:hypothetical protein
MFAGIAITHEPDATAVVMMGRYAALSIQTPFDALDGTTTFQKEEALATTG